MRHEGEPSVEEILESIKKVIARDNRDSADSLRRKREEEGLVVSPATPFRPDQLRESSPPQPTTAAADGEDVLDLSADLAEPVADAAADAPAALTNDAAADAMRQSLAALAMLAEPPAAPQIVRSGETSLDGLVREMLRPMLAQWLDTHLPPMVERLVTAEIARIAGKQR